MLGATVLLASALNAQTDDWQTARVVAAETLHAYNLVAVELGDLRVAAFYTAQLRARKASTLTIGETVQARVNGDDLELSMPSGKTVKATIAQRAARGVDAPLPPLSTNMCADNVAVPYSGQGTPVIPASDCIGAVVNGVCHGTPTPGAQIKIQTGQTPRCYGTMIGGRCTGPLF